MNNKKLIAINLNEFNLEFLRYGAKKFNCIYIKKFLKLKKIKTFSSDLKQDKNLDPWVQSISMNTGIRSNKHKIFNLGEKIPKRFIQIWDNLSANKNNCAVWGTMNTSFKNNENIKIFLPDPWNYQNSVKPHELENFYLLPREYAQNYTNFSVIKNFFKIFQLLIYLIKKLVFSNLIFLIPVSLNILFKKRTKNLLFFFLFDLISLKIFEKISRKYNLNFSLVFLNSLAHFQHNNWDEKLSHKYYFYFTNQLFKVIFNLSKRYDSMIIYNGFSQKKIIAEYMIRPKNPREFMRKIGIRFKSFHSNMTNGAIVSFGSKLDFKNAINILNNYNIFGYKFFELKIIKKNELFIRVQIRSKKNLASKDVDLKKVKNLLFYEEKNKVLKKNINLMINNFINSMVFIKTTSKHSPDGVLFYKGFEIKNKKIENIKIFNLINDYFKKK